MMSGLAFHEIELNGINGNRRAAFVSACFVLGFSVAFTSLGALAAGVESPLTPHLSTIQKVSSLLIVGYGILLTGLVPRHFIPNRDCGPAGAFTMGLAFAFGWVPCVGLVLAGILALAAGENVARGSALLFTYSLGLGLPLIVIGLAANLLLSIFVRCQRHLRAGKIASGALLICIASSQHCPQIVEESSKTAYAAKGGCTSPP